MYKLNNTSAVTKVSFILYDGHCCGQVRSRTIQFTHSSNEYLAVRTFGRSKFRGCSAFLRA